MRSIFITIYCIIFTLIASLASGGQTIVSNAGFEVNTWGTGFADEWWGAPSGSSAYFNPDPNKARSGKAYITLVSGADGWSNAGPTYQIAVAHDANYIIGGYIADANDGQAGFNPAGTAVIRVDWYAQAGQPYDQRLGTSSITPAVPKDGNYYYYSGIVRNTYGANFVTVIAAANRVSGQSPKYRFDDIVFAEANRPATADFNGDRKVDFLDFSNLAKGFKISNIIYDMNGDEIFGFDDMSIFAGQWLRSIPDLPGYQFAWSDEFDGISIDRTNWTYDVGDSWYNGELQSYTDRVENSGVENGFLIITARQEQYHTNNYTSARIRSNTKTDFLYGRMEARIKLPAGQGIWPAFWMMPTASVYGGWPGSGELDILETINKCDRVYGTMHFTDTLGQHAASGGSLYSNGLIFADDFHIYAIEWEPNEIRWYVDNVNYFSETNWSSGSYPYPSPFNQQFYFILNIAIGGAWAGPPDVTTIFPQRMLVDWVRVYQKQF